MISDVTDDDPGGFENTEKKIQYSNGRFPAAWLLGQQRARRTGFVHFLLIIVTQPAARGPPREPESLTFKLTHSVSQASLTGKLTRLQCHESGTQPGLELENYSAGPGPAIITGVSDPSLSILEYPGGAGALQLEVEASDSDSLAG